MLSATYLIVPKRLIESVVQFIIGDKIFEAFAKYKLPIELIDDVVIANLCLFSAKIMETTIDNNNFLLKQFYNETLISKKF